MSSLEDFEGDHVRSAIELCNTSELKEELLGARKFYCEEIGRFKELWNKLIENKAEEILENSLSKKKLKEKQQDEERVELKQKVVGFVILIAMRMLKWVTYHQGILDLPREFSIRFLNSSFFTSLGTIDNKKTAEELIKHKNFSITQKYKLACLYCLTEHIPNLYRQMSWEDMKEFYDDQRPHRIDHPELVKFWSYYLADRIDELRGAKTLDEYRLEAAVKSGCKAAVEYCIEETDVNRNDDAVIDAALETVRNKIRTGTIIGGTITVPFENDCIVFQNQRSRGALWIPSDYFVDILYCLLSKMREDQQIKFLKKDIEGAYYEVYENPNHSRALEYLLDWPYQHYFMQTAQLTWDFLPGRAYVDLLLKMCEKMDTSIENLKYGEEKSYDYRKLLAEFWSQSPTHYKEYVLKDQEITLWTGQKETLNGAEKLLFRLLTLRDFTDEDWENIELIFSWATDKEKENIIYSKEGKSICVDLMILDRWAILEEFVSKCLPSKKNAQAFKGILSASDYSPRAYGYYSAGHKSHWPEDPKKKKSSYFRERINACIELYMEEGEEMATKFCEWCFSSDEEKIRIFKKQLLFGANGICADLIIEDKLDLVDGFVRWGLSSEEEIAEFKKRLEQEKGNYICGEFISGGFKKTISEDFKIKGGKWEQVVKYLTWSFSSEEEISDFKKRLLEESGINIHYKLVRSNQWEEAERFFEWIGMSPNEVKKLKKETLFNHEKASYMFIRLMYSGEGPKIYPEYGSNQEAIDLLLRWYLTDLEAILEFRDHFKQRHEGWELGEAGDAVLEDFDSAIEVRLSDFIEEEEDESSSDEET